MSLVRLSAFPAMRSPLSVELTSPVSTRWPPFVEILHQLHQGGIYIHADQLAEFLLWHGLPVDLCYVPQHLQEKATMINANYQGDMARLEDATAQDGLDRLPGGLID